MDKRIYLRNWLELKPYKKQTVTDSYYLKVCNDIKKLITTNKQSLILYMYLDEDDIDLLACFLTSYFEDLISETNIWKSFTQAHKRLYKKQLPFYAVDEYYEEETNPQDISFLIWYFLNTVQEEKFISPFNTFIVETAEKIAGVFDDLWEYAPVNEFLKSFYRIDQNEQDFYVARKLIDTVLFNTYLFYPDTSLKLKKQEIEILDKSYDHEHLAMILNENRDRILHKAHTRLLSFKGKEWVSEILGENHLLTKDFLNISKKVQGLFLYKGQDENNIYIEHIASGKKFNLTMKSFDYSHTLKEVDTILYMGIAQWKDEWWFSGVFFQQPYNPDLILDEKNSLESRMEVNFLDHQSQDTASILKNQLSAFKDFAGGSQIVFLPSDSIEEFYKGYIEFLNNSLKLTEKEIQYAKQRARNDGFFGTNDKNRDFSEVSETGLVFFNQNSGCEIALSVNSAFPMSSNLYFKEEDSEEHVLSLMMDESLSTELAMFCIDNCKNKLSFFNKGIEKKYLDDIDFLLRFWKKDYYHTKPSITFTGQNAGTTAKK
jgi:hypothetical protein